MFLHLKKYITKPFRVRELLSRIKLFYVGIQEIRIMKGGSKYEENSNLTSAFQCMKNVYDSI